jgi:catechol-2,3-dioxygenase
LKNENRNKFQYPDNFVQDENKLKAFYTEILEVEIREEIPGEWVLLKAGNCQVA